MTDKATKRALLLRKLAIELADKCRDDSEMLWVIYCMAFRSTEYERDEHD